MRALPRKQQKKLTELKGSEALKSLEKVQTALAEQVESAEKDREDRKREIKETREVEKELGRELRKEIGEKVRDLTAKTEEAEIRERLRTYEIHSEQVLEKFLSIPERDGDKIRRTKKFTFAKRVWSRNRSIQEMQCATYKELVGEPLKKFGGRVWGRTEYDANADLYKIRTGEDGEVVRNNVENCGQIQGKGADKTEARKCKDPQKVKKWNKWADLYGKPFHFQLCLKLCANAEECAGVSLWDKKCVLYAAVTGTQKTESKVVACLKEEGDEDEKKAEEEDQDE